MHDPRNALYDACEHSFITKHYSFVIRLVMFWPSVNRTSLPKKSLGIQINMIKIYGRELSAFRDFSLMNHFFYTNCCLMSFYFSLSNWRCMMFNPKRVLILKNMNFKNIVWCIKAISYFVLLRSLGNISWFMDTGNAVKVLKICRAIGEFNWRTFETSDPKSRKVRADSYDFQAYFYNPTSYTLYKALQWFPKYCSKEWRIQILN